MSDQSTESKFAIASKRVVTPEGEIESAIVIDGERIAAVVPRSTLPLDMNVVDVGDLVVSPGVIDTHVHINEPGRTEWEGFETATRSAAAGGVTTLIDMPLNSIPVTTSSEALKTKQEAAAGKCVVDVGFYGGLVPSNIERIGELVRSGVMGIKAFLCDSGLDEFPASGERELSAALERLRGTGVPLLAHAEIAEKTTAPTNPKSHAQFARSRPERFELRAIQLLIDLCKQFETPIYIVHLATAAALPMIEEAKRDGLPITVETCPHYLYFHDAEIEDGQTSFKCAPPIRDRGNRDALRDAVASGMIETIGSDHSPCSPELKCLDTGDFSRAWGGIASLQLTLSTMWTIAKEAGWPRSLLADRLSHRPAEVFGMANRKGRIAPGCDADLVIWDPDGSFAVHGRDLEHRHDVTPYEGRQLFGKVERTYLRGKLIFRSDSTVNHRHGQLLHRSETNRIAKHLNSLGDRTLADTLETCCASTKWIQQMISGGPFLDDQDVFRRCTCSCQELDENDWLQAFTAHPKIGDVDSLREKYANTKSVAGNEQAGVNEADEQTLMRLSAANDEYFEKFGFIFIVCATGKSASEMLAILESRLTRTRDEEVTTAAEEQRKITEIRLRKIIA